MTVRLVVEMSPDLRKALKVQAAREDKTLSDLVRWLAESYLEACEPG